MVNVNDNLTLLKNLRDMLCHLKLGFPNEAVALDEYVEFLDRIKNAGILDQLEPVRKKSMVNERKELFSSASQQASMTDSENRDFPRMFGDRRERVREVTSDDASKIVTTTPLRVRLANSIVDFKTDFSNSNAFMHGFIKLGLGEIMAGELQRCGEKAEVNDKDVFLEKSNTNASFVVKPASGDYFCLAPSRKEKIYDSKDGYKFFFEIPNGISSDDGKKFTIAEPAIVELKDDKYYLVEKGKLQLI